MTAGGAASLLRRSLLALVAIAAALVVMVSGASRAPAAAADLGQFRPGNVMSDEVFFNGSWLSEVGIQSFLEVKGAGCVKGPDGSACLKDYRASTFTRAADDRCRGTYAGASNERASTIIAKVAQACGINPQVLIVILQKEQGLVATTGAAATAARYQKAMGFGCPDTAPCDERYYGFYNQVYQAAWQFRSYAVNPAKFAHRAGMVNNVRFHPDAACGTAPVLIENQATAGLYNYTPYQPNQAALAAGYGTGDSCSSYGNRNFWNYYTDWFGPTYGYSVSPQMTALWNSLGGPAGSLGVPVSGQRCDLVPTGCSQDFSNARVYWSPTTGAQAVGGIILSRWTESGGPASIGYPTSTVLACDPGAGCLQTFESGAVSWSGATGAQLVGGQIYARWASAGGLGAGIGYPTTTVLSCDATAGCQQAFERGAVTWSGATGPQIIGGIMQARWNALGGSRSELGYPISTVLACDPAVGCAQAFTHGYIAWSAATGDHVVQGAVAAGWRAAGDVRAGIGLPVETLVSCPSTGCVQRFAGGAVTWSPTTGGQLIGGLIYQRWTASGGLAAGLGYPTSTVLACPSSGCIQTFEQGVGTWSPAAGAQLVGGLLWARWAGSGVLDAGIGMPTSTVLGCAPAGCVQPFERGALTWSADAGAQLVGGAIYSHWRSLGGEGSALGLPTSTVLGCDGARGCRQEFRGGVITWSASTGAQSVTGSILQFWSTAGGEASPLGYPASTSASCAAPAGCLQLFTGGAVDWSSERGAIAIVGQIATRWAASGGVDAGIGRPLTSSLGCNQATGCTQVFERGAVASSTATGAHLVGGQIYELWSRVGGEGSSLGLPTSTVLGCDALAGCVQQFQGGSIRWSAATGAYRA